LGSQKERREEVGIETKKKKIKGKKNRGIKKILRERIQCAKREAGH